jgi:hypothetical protein
VYYTDFHKIWVEWAKKKLNKIPIKTSHEIRCIDRSNEKEPVIKYTYPDGNFYKWGTQKCSALIFAFPPTLTNLERAGLDLVEQENAVFKDVDQNNYFSSAVELALPFGVSYIANSSNPSVPPPADGEPVAVLRLSERSNVSTSWSWGTDEVANKTAFDLLNSTMSDLNRDPRNNTAHGEALAPSNIRAFRQWDYFPHFNTQPLKDGAYGKLLKLQGCRRSYWASGLQGMEIVEWAVRAGADVVDNYFVVASTGGGYIGNEAQDGKLMAVY